jgi:hypothetical protein
MGTIVLVGAALAGAATLVGRRRPTPARHEPGPDAASALRRPTVDLLDERFARGELDEREYVRLRDFARRATAAAPTVPAGGLAPAARAVRREAVAVG